MRTEVPAHDIPGGNEIVPALAGNVHGGHYDVCEAGARRRERGPQIRHHLFGLRGHIARGHRQALLVERAKHRR
jgi:hypothetical protein